VGWFKAARPGTVSPDCFPVFILERGPDNVIYGLPDFEQRGVKAAPHNQGLRVSADDAELLPVSQALAELVPGAASPEMERQFPVGRPDAWFLPHGLTFLCVILRSAKKVREPEFWPRS
jgi:hypothetical protein